MDKQIDYQILLQEVVRTAKAAAQDASGRPDAQSRFTLLAYYDILDVVKTQAEIMEVPLSEIGLDGYDADALLAVQAAPRRQAA